MDGLRGKLDSWIRHSKIFADGHDATSLEYQLRTMPEVANSINNTLKKLDRELYERERPLPISHFNT